MPLTGTKSSSNIILTDPRIQAAGSPVILFDGVCNLCNNAVQFILSKDKQKIFRFCSLQSESGKLLLADPGLGGQFIDSVILFEHGKFYTHSEAIIRIAEILGGIYSVAVVFRVIPKILRDSLYTFLANHRYRWFGKRQHCMIPEPGLSDRFLV